MLTICISIVFVTVFVYGNVCLFCDRFSDHFWSLLLISIICALSPSLSLSSLLRAFLIFSIASLMSNTATPWLSFLLSFCKRFSSFFVKNLNLSFAPLLGNVKSKYPFSSPLSVNGLYLSFDRSTVVSIFFPFLGSVATIGKSLP